MRRILAIACLSAALTVPALAQMATISPAEVGEIFCIARLGNDMAPVEGLLAPSLAQAIADAEAANTAWEKAHPGDKPPLGDGIPWQTWPDYAPQCTAAAADSATGTVSVEIRYAFPDSPDANFADRLRLVHVDDPATGTPLWRIDNVEYAEGGDLRSALVSAFAD
jgi:hypothetical protein